MVSRMIGIISEDSPRAPAQGTGRRFGGTEGRGEGGTKSSSGLKRKNNLNFANLQNASHFCANASENGSPEGLRAKRDHFRDRLGPVESNRDDEKVQKWP